MHRQHNNEKQNEQAVQTSHNFSPNFSRGIMFSSATFLSIVFYPQLKYHTHFELREHSFGFLNISFHLFHIFCSCSITDKKLHDCLTTACKQQKNTVPSAMLKNKGRRRKGLCEHFEGSTSRYKNVCHMYICLMCNDRPFKFTHIYQRSKRFL